MADRTALVVKLTLNLTLIPTLILTLLLARRSSMSEALYVTGVSRGPSVCPHM